jgi:hypothetical protein
MHGVIPTGTAEMSISMWIETPTSIEISTETRPSKTCSSEGKPIRKVRESGSITRSTARVFPIEIRERPESLTG